MGGNPELVVETKNRILSMLVLVNLGIWVTSGGFAYLLSGKTLSPIEKMLEEQKRFVADASHELRTPLTALKTEIEVAMIKRDLSDKELREILKSNLEEVEKIQTLTDDLLSLNRHQMQNSLEDSSLVSFKEVANELENKFRPLIKKKNLILEKNISTTFVNIKREELIKVLSVLLDNAIKYSPKASRVILSMQTKGKNVVLTVQDFGVGITSSDIPHIFDRFYRADSSRTKTKTEGFGLGLAIAKEIVDSWGGKIEVTSKVGEGSKFQVIFRI
jgi:two-component system OmpR family sensor kinase